MVSQLFFVLVPAMVLRFILVVIEEQVFSANVPPLNIFVCAYVCTCEEDDVAPPGSEGHVTFNWGEGGEGGGVVMF